MNSSPSSRISCSAGAQDLEQLLRGRRLGLGAERRKRVELGVTVWRAARAGGTPSLRRTAGDEPVGLIEQREQQVRGLDVGVLACVRGVDCGAQRLLGLDREAVGLHV